MASRIFDVTGYRTTWRRTVAWVFCAGVIFMLGTLRTATDAEFAFASLALLPVLAIAWFGGRADGLAMAFLAAAMWASSDIAAERQFSADWVPWVNAFVRFFIYGLVAVLAAQLRLQLAKESERATRDPLTGLSNRRAFLETGAVEIKRSKRYAHPLAVVFLDLDDFKQLNDRRGHDVGDEALRATAGALDGVTRSTDCVARLGGDEFAILLPETNYDAAVETGRKIISAAKRVLVPFPPVAASVGVAWFEAADRPFADMLKSADELMYAAKQKGRGAMEAQRFAAKVSSKKD